MSKSGHQGFVWGLRDPYTSTSLRYIFCGLSGRPWETIYSQLVYPDPNPQSAWSRLRHYIREGRGIDGLGRVVNGTLPPTQGVIEVAGRWVAQIWDQERSTASVGPLTDPMGGPSSDVLILYWDIFGEEPLDDVDPEGLGYIHRWKFYPVAQPPLKSFKSFWKYQTWKLREEGHPLFNGVHGRRKT